MKFVSIVFAWLLAGLTCAAALPTNWRDQNNEGGLTIAYGETTSLIGGQTNVTVTLTNGAAVKQSYNLFFGARAVVTVGQVYTAQVLVNKVSNVPVFQVGYHLFSAADAYVGEDSENFATIPHTATSASLPGADINVSRLAHTYTIAAGVGKIEPRITLYDIDPGASISFNILSVASALGGSPVAGGGTPPAPGPGTTLTSTLALTSANNGQTFDNYTISTISGNCITMTGVNNVTFQNSRIGPCAGQGIDITGSSTNVKIYDNYIHVNNLASGCCDTRLGIKVQGNSNAVTIQGNVVAYSETNFRVQGGANNVLIDGNFSLNPRGPFPRGQHLQVEGSASGNVTFTYNYTLSAQSGYTYPADQEDAVNFYHSSGNTATFNYLTGGDSGSGCALLVDELSNNNSFTDNTVYNSGQCGIGISGGQTTQVLRNKVLNLTPIAGAGDVGMYVWNQYASTCSGVTVSNNQISMTKDPGCNPATSTCVFNSYWDGGGCGTVTGSGNSYDNGTYGANAAPVYNSLKTAVPAAAPKIPPKPKNCVANSPYSNQTGFPPCS
jgi:hypothetical protein